MKTIFTIIFLTLIFPRTFLTQNLIWNSIYNSYENFKEPNIFDKRISHSYLTESIKKIEKSDKYSLKVAGKSLEGRKIFHISIGQGKVNVLLWSQMHGDEPTATMALLDIINFFNADDDFNQIRKSILENLSIHIIPMLNPDGAEQFTRRNALHVDLNRDALRLQFPESKILKSLRDSIDAEFAFNLHDQNPRYSAGNSYRSATLSFLAPAFNYQKDINEVRANTMKLISDICTVIEDYIPGHIAKYKDDFEPRAFGDKFMKWGTGSVLIESGGWKNDEDKQFIRKLNFISILVGLYSIANKLYEKADIEIYNNLPFNDNLLFDLLLKNLAVKYSGQNYIIDIGINRDENYTKDLTQSYWIGKIEDWGDLSIFYGLDEFNLEGYEIRESKIFETEIQEINELDIDKLLKRGYGFVKLKRIAFEREFSSIPLNIIIGDKEIDLEPKYSGFANFTIWKKGKLEYNVINGFIYDVNSYVELNKNGVIIR